MTKRTLWLSALALGASACAAPAKVDKPRSQMTQRERDSTFAESGLPGAGAVRKAMNMADKENARQAMIDSITNEN
jgi:hypothetical protein